jgi:hypothetical protein
MGFHRLLRGSACIEKHDLWGYENAFLGGFLAKRLDTG